MTQLGVMPNEIANNPIDDDGETTTLPRQATWDALPDQILLSLFKFLYPRSLLRAAQTCKQWYRVGVDEFLWKDLVKQRFGIADENMHLAPAAKSWRREFERLYCETPFYESEVMTEHRDQVLHISFSHNGKYFATSSKDGTVKVWEFGYPTYVKYYEDMRSFSWRYTQYTQFNASDTLLLVSGVTFGANNTSGEIAVFNIQSGFNLQCKVRNKPYDIFGTWYNDQYLLSGNLHWLGNFSSCSVIYLNKSTQDLDKIYEPVVMQMFKFDNINASSVRTIMIANCSASETSERGDLEIQDGADQVKQVPLVTGTDAHNISLQGPEITDDVIEKSEEGDNTDSADFMSDEKYFGENFITDENVSHPSDTDDGASSFDVKLGISETCGLDATRFNRLGDCCRGLMVPSVERPGDRATFNRHDNEHLSALLADEVAGASAMIHSIPQEYQREDDKYLIFTTGRRTYTPHQIGIKRIKHERALGKMSGQADLRRLALQQQLRNENEEPVIHSDLEEINTRDPADCLIDLDGHIIGMILSPDHRRRHEQRVKQALHARHRNPDNPPHDDRNLMDNEHREQPFYWLANHNEYIAEAALLQEERNEPMDDIEHLIEMDGHIIGMCLSRDQRYLYVNTRAWPPSYEILDPFEPPPIANQIEIHVIDLATMRDLGVMHRAHKAFTLNDECFFIFLDVSPFYVASGAEDQHGYLWDRHYRILLNKFRHTDVVNCVAFHPRDQQTLVSVSDDHSVKIWRSRKRCRELGILEQVERVSIIDESGETRFEPVRNVHLYQQPEINVTPALIAQAGDRAEYNVIGQEFVELIGPGDDGEEPEEELDFEGDNGEAGAEAAPELGDQMYVDCINSAFEDM